MRRILIVEDEPMLRRGTLHLLDHEGFRAEACGSVAEAKKRLKAVRFDLVITDYHLGDGETGLDLLVFLRAHNPGVPAILVSGVPEQSLAHGALRLGAHSFLPKPFAPSLLLQTCREALATKKRNILFSGKDPSEST